MGYVFGGGGGGGGAPTGTAGGDLSGTYPNPTVAQVNGVSAASYALLAGPTFTGTVTLPASTVTNAMLAGSIAASKVTGTAITAADSGTVTSTMIADGTIAGGDIASSVALAGNPTTTSQAIGDNTTKIATTAAAIQAALYEDYLLSGSQKIRKTFQRRGTTDVATIAALTTQVMSSYAVVLYAGDVITNISFRSGTTAGSALSNWWFALYDTQATPAIISQTADQTSTAWAASTVKTLALSTNGGAQTISTTGVYYVSIMVNATTVPTLVGVSQGVQSIDTGYVAGQKSLAVTSGSALTTTAPGTITSSAATTVVPYVELS